MSVLLGLNVGGTATSFVAGGSDGTVRARRSWPTSETPDGASLSARALALREELVAEAGGGPARALGVAIGGPLDAYRGVVLSPPHLPGFADEPLRDRLSRAFALPVVVHHDAAACALAEWRWGAARAVDGIAYLTCGTGFGAGLVLGGRVRYGGNGHSPELGHVRYRDQGPAIFGKPGCYEGFGSASALKSLAAQSDARFASATPAEVVAAAREGDAVARDAFEANVAAVGSACAMLADLLVLDAIVLGSLARYLGRPWIDAVQTVFANEALASNVAACRLLPPSFDDVQDRSALAAAHDA